ncbi:hypothetical protein KRR40_08375 [Niabella defluvii]|nr:hypothetical protein KRR40_08375 [Niabella sp. I65]
MEKASEAVSAIFRAGFTPSALELMEINALRIVSSMVDNHAMPVNDRIEAHLLIEVDGNDTEVLIKEMEQIAGVLENYEAGNFYLQKTHSKKKHFGNCGAR